MDVCSTFIRLMNKDDELLFPNTISSYIAQPDSVIHVKVEMRVKDSLGKVHFYSPSFLDTVSMIVTDVQNCPFLRLPMKLTKEGVDCNPNTPIWNLLSDVNDNTIFRVTEVLIRHFVNV